MHFLTRADVVVQFHDLVWYTVKKFMRPGLEKDDLAQEGFCGLLKAYDRYDPDRGVSFMTYAYPWVYAAVQTHAENFSEPTHRSHNSCTQLLNANKEKVLEDCFVAYPYCGDDNDPFESLLQNEERNVKLDRMLDSKIVYEAIMYLPLIHQRVLLSYFFEDQCLSSLTETLGVTKQRVHQIYKKAIVMLRKRLHVRTTVV
jgi:RNA polymerase sigma factor (sigma-70 family)